MATKITIIGAGSVGSTIAFMMAVKGIASEIVIIDINEKKALGEAMDIRQGTPFCQPVQNLRRPLFRRSGFRYRGHHVGHRQKAGADAFGSRADECKYHEVDRF